LQVRDSEGAITNTRGGCASQRAETKTPQGEFEGEPRIQDNRKAQMKRMFLYGTLCGVIMAADLTFSVAIPANNDRWHVEIVKRGGGTWSLDKNDKLRWMWTVQPLPERTRPAIIIVPPSRSKPASSPGRSDTIKL